MSDRQTLAEHGAGLGLAVAGLAGGGPVDAVLVPGAVLGALVLDTYRGCADRGARRAMTKALDKLRRVPDFAETDIAAALALFQQHKRGIRFDPADLARAVATDDPAAAVLRAVFGDAFDRQEPGARAALRAAIAPALDAARQDADFDRVFVQEVTSRTLRAQGKIVQGLDRIEGRQAEQTDILRDLQERMGGIAAALNRPQALTLEDLQWLAAKFGGAPEGPRPALIDFLGKKAEEYRAFQAQIAAIDDRTRGLGKLKAAAQDAAERLDFAKVEALLSRVHAVEVEIAAETAELRAGNALLRGRVQQAFDLLSAAADGFAAIDPVEPARRRVRYGEQLGQHGERFGGPGLALAQTMLRRALDWLDETDRPQDRAAAQNALGIALAVQGERTAGDAGAALLAEAVDSYRAALRVTTEADHPLHWAMTMQNLGTALQTQGERTAGDAGAALLAEAVDSYRAALRVRTEADHPLDWAMTMQNLGNALQTRGGRTAGDAGAALLAEAAESHRAALRVFTEADHPLHWATTMQNLGNALATQGERTAGDAGAALLAEAAESYRAALRVRSEADHPLAWATTRENMAILEEARAQHDRCADRAAHLRAALDHVDAALTVYDPDHMPFYHQKATRLRDRIRAALDDPRGG